MTTLAEVLSPLPDFKFDRTPGDHRTLKIVFIPRQDNNLFGHSVLAFGPHSLNNDQPMVPMLTREIGRFHLDLRVHTIVEALNRLTRWDVQLARKQDMREDEVAVIYAEQIPEPELLTRGIDYLRQRAIDQASFGKYMRSVFGEVLTQHKYENLTNRELEPLVQALLASHPIPQASS